MTPDTKPPFPGDGPEDRSPPEVPAAWPGAGIVAPVTRPPEVWTIVVAGGSARRYGAVKQFERLGGTTVLGLACRAAATVSDGVVVVVPASAIDGGTTPDLGGVRATIVAGGGTRAASVRCGLTVVPDQAEVVLVHDGARPLASPELFARVVAAVRAGAEAVVPATPVVDTLRWRSGGIVSRDDLCRVQTPQGFAAAALRDAHRGGGDATDDATLAENSGCSVTIVDGEESNLKITTPLDLVIAAALMEAAA